MTDAASSDREQRFNDIVAAHLEAVEAGRPQDWRQLQRSYPDLAPEIEAFFAEQADLGALAAPLRALVRGASSAPNAAGAAGLLPPDSDLGDYHLVCVIGRGGMGVVYEAQQKSLGRRVALKVLPFAAALDARQLHRFKNEAAAAAHLHHTNIVPVYAVGSERGIHFYAMQFIDGQTLAQVIADSRAGTRSNGPKDPAAFASSAIRPSKSALFTEASLKGAAFFRTVVHLGVQAAQALEYAHQMGVVHRDIKPGNLLVETSSSADRSGARLWITDFGLAQMQSDTRLTMTGDIVGTLRYMSPEQALAQRVVLDHRTDIYSLGATLYELVTREPAFTGQDRQELLRQIAFEEPRPPRRIDPSIPVELETILLKAMAKNPAERYGTAQDLADDLERFRRDEPIRAKRPSYLQRARKWARRRKGIVVTAAVGLFLTMAVLAGSIGWIVRDRTTRQTQLAEDVQWALQETQTLRDRALTLVDDNPSQWESTLAAALAASKRAQTLANQDRESLDAAVLEQLSLLNGQLQADDQDRQFVARLDEIRLEGAQVDVDKNRFQGYEQGSKIKDLFKAHGIEVATTTAEQVAAFIARRSPPIQKHMLAALDAWSQSAPADAVQERQWLEAARAAADQDPWRKQVRRALTAKDWKAVEDLVRQVEIGRHAPAFLILVARGLDENPRSRLALLRQVQRAHPGDFWANHDYGMALANEQPPRGEEALRYLQAALALRPRSPGVYVNLGYVLSKKGDPRAAGVELRKAVELGPQWAWGHSRFGYVLCEGRDFAAGVVALRRAVELGADDPATWYYLADACLAAGQRAAHRQVCADMMQRYRDNPDSHWANSILFASLPSADALADMSALIPLAEVRLQGKPDPRALGAALYRSQKYKEAIARLNEGSQNRAWDNFFLAMAHYRLGAGDKAREFLDAGQQRLRTADYPWTEVAESEELRREAETLIVGMSVARPSVRLRGTLKGHTGMVSCLAFEREGKILASGGSHGDHTIKLWDLAAETEIATIKGHSQAIVSVAFSPDGANLASGSLDRTLKVWRADARTERKTLPTEVGWSVAFSHDGKLVAATAEKGVQLWDAVTFEEKMSVAGAEKARALAFAPDGKTLAVTIGWNTDRNVQFWDVATGQLRADPDGHAGGAGCLAFSRDGTLLATGSHDRTVTLWDVATATLLATLPGHTKLIEGVAFSPDGKLLASCECNWQEPERPGEVKLWDVATRKEVLTIPHPAGVWCAVFSPSGQTLATAGADRIIRLFDVIAPAESPVVTPARRAACTHLEAGHALRGNGKLDEAVAEYRQALNLDAPFTQAHSALAQALLEKGDPAGAIAAYRSVLELDPPSTWVNDKLAVAHGRVAHAHANQGHWEKAAAESAKALELGADAADLETHGWPLAWLRMTLGDAAEHRGNCLRLLERYEQTTNPRLALQAARICTLHPARVIEVKRAVQLAQRAAELDPDNAHFWDTLALAHYRAGDWKAAVAAHEKAMPLRERTGTVAEWHFVVAMAHWQRGDKAQARQWYDQGVSWLKENGARLNALSRKEVSDFRAEAAVLLGLPDRGVNDPPD